jgi:hypothetical protein
MRTIYWRILSLIIATIAVCLIAAAEQAMDLGPIPGKVTPFTTPIKSYVKTAAGDIIEGDEWVRNGVVE